MKKMLIALGAAAVLLAGLWFVGTGFLVRTDVVLVDYEVAADGSAVTLHCGVAGSMGYIRAFRDEGGGVQPHYLRFFSAFGGPNGSWGARNEFVLELDEQDAEIRFIAADGGTPLVLYKDGATGQWLRPE